MRVKFKKGCQRAFIDNVLVSIGCPTLIELVNRGVDTTYSSLKNYYSERRLMPLELFEDMLKISGLKKTSFSFELLADNWGKVEGGRISKKS